MSYDPNQPQPPDPSQQPQNPYGQPQPPYEQQWGQPPPPYSGQPGQPQQPPYGQPGQPQAPYGQQWGQEPPRDYAPTQYIAPAYGTQAAPGYAPPQQPRRSRRGLWIVLGIIGGLIVLSCAVCGILFATGAGIFGGIIGSVAGPTYTVDQYYNAVEKQDYTTAYSYIEQNSTGPNGQQLNAQAYSLLAQGLDALKGKVNSYTIGQISPSGNITSITVSVKRANVPAYNVQLQLRQVNGTWKIFSSDNI